MRQLDVTGRKTTFSLTTMEKVNSKTESSIVSLELSDLKGENQVRVETVFSTPKLPVSIRNIATQKDIDRWPHLSNIQIDQIDAEVGLLIGSDVPMELEAREIKRSQDGGPYATRTVFGWVINGPLGRASTTPLTANFVVAADVNVDEQFENFCNLEFNDVNQSNKPNLSREDHRALDIMNSSAKLKNCVAVEEQSSRHAK